MSLEPTFHSTKCQLRVGGVPEHFNLPWHLALETNQFKYRGLKVTYQDFPGGTGAMTAALANDQLDIAILLAEGAVADIVNRGESHIVKVYVESPLIWGIHVAADSEIETVDQIRNQRYAISRPGSGSHLMAIVDAAERGWPTDSMVFEPVQDLHGARQQLGRSADIFFWERFTTQPLVDRGEFRRVGQRETLWPAFVIVASDRVLHQEPDAVRRCLQVINQQCQTLMARSDAVELISYRYDLDREQVRKWFSRTTWSVDFRCPRSDLRRVVEYLRRLQIIPQAPLELTDLWWDLDAEL